MFCIFYTVIFDYFSLLFSRWKILEREIFYFLEKDYMFEILYALVSFTNFAVVLWSEYIHSLQFTYSVAGIFLFLFYFIFFEVKRLLNLNILFTEFY